MRYVRPSLSSPALPTYPDGFAPSLRPSALARHGTLLLPHLFPRPPPHYLATVPHPATDCIIVRLYTRISSRDFVSVTTEQLRERKKERESAPNPRSVCVRMCRYARKTRRNGLSVFDVDEGETGDPFYSRIYRPRSPLVSGCSITKSTWLSRFVHPGRSSRKELKDR